MPSADARARRRSESPFATHVPVCLALARLRRISRVLELGAGLDSTLTFLNRTAYPELEVLHSYENNTSWVDQLRETNRLIHDHGETLAPDRVDEWVGLFERRRVARGA